MQKITTILFLGYLLLPRDSLADSRDRSAMEVDYWAQVSNAAYLIFAHERCGLSVGTMVDQYRSRAMASGLTPEQVARMITDLVKHARSLDGQNWTDFSGDFCTEARKSLPKFLEDLSRSPD